MAEVRRFEIPVVMPSPAFCAECVSRMTEAVKAVEGVETARVDARTTSLAVTYDPARVSSEELESRVREIGLEVAADTGHAAYKLSGLDCPDCASTIDKSIAYIDGVRSAELNFANGVLVVEYDPKADPRDGVVSTVRKMGYGIEPETVAGAARAEFRVIGLDCPDCADKLRKRIEALEGVREAGLDAAVARLKVTYDESRITADRLAKAVTEAGYAVEAAEAERGAEATPQVWWGLHRKEVGTAASGVLLVAGWLAGALGFEAGSVAVYAAAILVAGLPAVRRALASLRARTLDMNVLMTVAVVGAAAIGEWAEAATVIFLFALGGLLESRALARTRRSIGELMDLTPPRARIRRDGRETEVPPAEVRVGDLLVVRPGERVALDGEVVAGSSAVDESPITGESAAADKAPGERVFAGTLNTSGLLEVRVGALWQDSTLSRVIYMVEEAQARRAPAQRLVDRFTRYYTPAVVLGAVAVAAVPPLVTASGFADVGGFGTWFYRALVLLVVSCPCALVISTPVAIVSAITRATRDGLLVKGGVHLETARKVRVVAFDKTGTLTYGRPHVADVVALDGRDRDCVLRWAGALEAASGHPVAKAVTRAARPAPETVRPESFEELPGRGVKGEIEGRTYTVTSPYAAEEAGVLDEPAAREAARLEGEGKTVLVLSSEGKALGLVAVADEVRAESAAALRALRGAGIERTVMLTGDNERAARLVGEAAGVDEVEARLLPGDKVEALQRLREAYGPVAMVGDGVNDAPALAMSDLGIAMGAAGSDTALETADVALMGDDLSTLPSFFDLGRRTVANIAQNVAFSIAVKFAVLVAAVAGIATLWMAVFADTGVSLLVILNGLRLLRRRGTAGA